MQKHTWTARSDANSQIHEGKNLHTHLYVDFFMTVWKSFCSQSSVCTQEHRNPKSRHLIQHIFFFLLVLSVRLECGKRHDRKNCQSCYFNALSRLLMSLLEFRDFVAVEHNMLSEQHYFISVFFCLFFLINLTLTSVGVTRNSSLLCYEGDRRYNPSGLILTLTIATCTHPRGQRRSIN